jgi:hypothetical protein
VVHSERAGALATRFVQLWLTGGPPAPVSYERAVVPVGTGLARVLPGLAAAALHVGHVGAEPVDVPAAASSHLYVARGEVEVAGLVLQPGDSCGWQRRGGAAGRPRRRRRAPRHVRAGMTGRQRVDRARPSASGTCGSRGTLVVPLAREEWQ